MNKGILLIVSGPAGVGKGTVCTLVAERNSDVFLSVSVTSRPPREGERDGEHYFFRTKEQFEEMIQNGSLLEYNQYVNGNYYGTPAVMCDEQIEKGTNLVLEIDVEGGRQVKERRPEAVMAFVVPPSFAELERRLREEAGIPTVMFDGDQSDPRVFSEAQYETRVDALIEIMAARRDAGAANAAN